MQNLLISNLLFQLPLLFREQRYVVSGGLDDLVKVWRWTGDGVEGELSAMHTLEGHSLGVISVDVNAEGTMAASSSLDSTIRLWNIHSGEQVGM